MIKIIIITIIALLFFFVSGCAPNTSNTNSHELDQQTIENSELEKAIELEQTDVEQDQPVREQPILGGENAVLKIDSLIARNKNSYDEMFRYFANDNFEAIERLVLLDELFLALEGTPVSVVDRKVTYALIEVISTGDRGYIAPEFLIREIRHESKKDNENTYSLNEIVLFETVEVKINEIREKQHNNKSYFIVNFTIKNNGNETVQTYDHNMNMFDANGEILFPVLFMDGDLTQKSYNDILEIKQEETINAELAYELVDSDYYTVIFSNQYAKNYELITEEKTWKILK